MSGGHDADGGEGGDDEIAHLRKTVVKSSSMTSSGRTSWALGAFAFEVAAEEDGRGFLGIHGE